MEKQGTSFTTPFSLVDMAKSLREALGLVKDIGDLLEKVGNVHSRVKARTVARAMRHLLFSHDGMLAELTLIEAGDERPQTFVILAEKLAATKAEYQHSLQVLERHRDWVAETYGIAAYNAIYEELIGFKHHARSEIEWISAVPTGRVLNLGDKKAQAAFVRDKAASLKELVERVHDALLNPRADAIRIQSMGNVPWGPVSR